MHHDGGDPRTEGGRVTIEQLLTRGSELEATGDWSSAAGAYRQAEAQGDTEAAMLLGLVLKRAGDLAGAEEAFGRAEARGHREAANSIGFLRHDVGDVAGAEDVYRRGIAAGSGNASLNLGLLDADHGRTDEALPHLRTAEHHGIPVASCAIGRIPRNLGDESSTTSAPDAHPITPQPPPAGSGRRRPPDRRGRRGWRS